MRQLLLAVLVLFVGCTSLPRPPRQDQPPPFEFRLGPGDRLRVSVWGEKQLEQELQLGADGAASLLLIGRVELGGLGLDEARVNRDRARDYLADTGGAPEPQ